MKIILIVSLVLVMFACDKKQEVNTEIQAKSSKSSVVNKNNIKKTEQVKVKNEVKEYDIEKSCSICHALPKFAEKEKDYLEKKLDFHRKERRITMTQEEYESLKKRVLERAKK